MKVLNVIVLFLFVYEDRIAHLCLLFLRYLERTIGRQGNNRESTLLWKSNYFSEMWKQCCSSISCVLLPHSVLSNSCWLSINGALSYGTNTSHVTLVFDCCYLSLAVGYFALSKVSSLDNLIPILRLISSIVKYYR